MITNLIQAGPKGNKYFCPPGGIPNNNQKMWNHEEDRQLTLLHSIFGGLNTSISKEKFFKMVNNSKKSGTYILRLAKVLKKF